MEMAYGRKWTDRQMNEHPLPPQAVFRLIGYGETPEAANKMARRNPLYLNSQNGQVKK
jgi:hypothetical protein